MFNQDAVLNLSSTDIDNLKTNCKLLNPLIYKKAILQLALYNIYTFTAQCCDDKAVRKLISCFKKIYQIRIEGQEYSDAATSIFLNKFSLHSDHPTLKTIFNYFHNIPNRTAEEEFIYGEFYLIGLGIEQDKDDAVEIIEEAACQGYAPAQHTLGQCYQRRRRSHFLDEYSELYEKAACQGDAPAQNQLANHYLLSGLGLRERIAKAIGLYQEAACQGYAPAQYNLGFLYTYGLGVPENNRKAVALYQRAACQGHTPAQNSLSTHMVPSGAVVSTTSSSNLSPIGNNKRPRGEI